MVALLILSSLQASFPSIKWRLQKWTGKPAERSGPSFALSPAPRVQCGDGAVSAGAEERAPVWQPEIPWAGPKLTTHQPGHLGQISFTGPGFSFLLTTTVVIMITLRVTAEINMKSYLWHYFMKSRFSLSESSPCISYSVVFESLWPHGL